MSRVRAARDKVRVVAGSNLLATLESRIDSLEVAVAENHALAAPLERVITEVERAVAGVIERSTPPDVGP